MPSNSALLSRPQISLLLPIYTTAFSDPGQCFMWIAASLQRPWPGQVLIVNQARALPRERVKQGDAQLTPHSQLVVTGTVSELLPGAILVQVGADFPFRLFLSA